MAATSADRGHTFINLHNYFMWTTLFYFSLSCQFFRCTVLKLTIYSCMKVSPYFWPARIGGMSYTIQIPHSIYYWYLYLYLCIVHTSWLCYWLHYCIFSTNIFHISIWMYVLVVAFFMSSYLFIFSRIILYLFASRSVKFYHLNTEWGTSVCHFTSFAYTHNGFRKSTLPFD